MTANITRTIQEDRMRAEEKGIEKGLQQGIEKGIEKGLQQGEKIKALEVAMKMLQRGMAIEDIIEITGLTYKDLEEIKH